jgi:release factor glutamine methyltransferase
MATVEQLLRLGVERLRASGSESARLDAELLLGKSVGLDRTRIIAYPEAPVGESAAAAYEADLARRERGEPIAYIRGLKEFHGLAFAIDARALIPRPETERLVDLAEAEIVTRLLAAPRPTGTPPVRVADVGTGAGTIAIALAVALRRRRMLDEVRILATEVDPDAIRLARENAVGHVVADRIEFIIADLLPLDGERLDVLAANLPYIPSADIDGLPIAASFEPRQALDGGPDGLDVIRAMLDRVPRVLRSDGVALLEIGSDQGERLAAEVATRMPGWTCEVLPDLAGLPRVARLEPASVHAVV